MPAEQTGSFRQRVLDALPADRPDFVRDFVRERVVQIPPARCGRSRWIATIASMDLGFDLLMAVQLLQSARQGPRYRAPAARHGDVRLSDD